MDRYRSLVIPGFLILSFSRRKSRDKRARFAPLPIPSLRCFVNLQYMQETADYSRKLFKTVFESEV
ncbi:hypothetical protein PAECIP112173_01805 [Paenibacillus sp. JJ-100]|nr:hypothetical protein PAECIP112173_01805 [Paenibacillus sp. JJ-100]